MANGNQNRFPQLQGQVNIPQAPKLPQLSTSFAGQTARSLIPGVSERVGRQGPVTPQFLERIGEASAQPAQVQKAALPPADFFARQFEQLTAPIREEIPRAREELRGTLAGGGTLRDFEGQQAIVDLEEQFADALARSAEDVQLNRMAQQAAIEQDFVRRLQQEDQARRASQLQGLGLEGRLGLQGRQQDITTLSDLLGRSQQEEFARRQQLLQIMQAPGFQDLPQVQIGEALLGELGLPIERQAPAIPAPFQVEGLGQSPGEAGAPPFLPTAKGQIVEFGGQKWMETRNNRWAPIGPATGSAPTFQQLRGTIL